MTAVILYFVVYTISVFIGYILYRIFLFKEPDFRNVRYYLLLVMIGSLVLPIVNFEIPSSLVNILQRGRQANFQNADPSFSIWPSKPEVPMPNAINYLTTIYFSVVFLLCSRMLFQISLLGACIYKSKKINKKGYTLVFNNRFDGTFSFFRWVFVNERMKHTEGINIIIAHEAAHCSQRHSIDVILAELISILFWFNPLIWKIKNAIKLNHEYLADQSVLNSGIIHSTAYQMLLLNKAAEGNLVSYVSSFSGNALKNRILMLLAIKNSAKEFKFKTIIVAVCCIILVFLTTGFINAKNNTAINQQPKTKTKNTDIPAKPIVKRPQDIADEPISVQNIPRRIKATKKIAEPNQITIKDIKIIK